MDIINSAKTNKTLLSAFVVALLTVIVYIPSLQSDFVNWDDGLFIYKNPAIQAIDLDFFKWIFTTYHTADWFPVTWISHAIDYAFWGLDPMGHHFTSIILHGLNTFFVVLLIAGLVKVSQKEESSHADGMPIVAGAVTGILFGIHPIHVESVAWVSERKDVLYSFFYLLSILSYIKYAALPSSGSASTNAGSKGYIFCLLFFILSLMSKAMAVTLPAVLIILDIYPLKRLDIKNALISQRKVLTEKIPFFLLSLAAIVNTVIANKSVGSMSPLDTAALGDRIIVAVRALGFYLLKMVWPTDLAPYYPYPSKISFFTPEHIGAFLLAAGITVFCLISWKKQKVFSIAWAYYIVILLPVIGIIKSGEQAAADRYTYLSSIGPFALIGLGTAILMKKSDFRVSIRSLPIIVCMTMIFAMLVNFTLRQEKLWKSPKTLWNHEISLFPDTAYLAYLNCGNLYIDSGNYAKAMTDYNKAIEINPVYADAYYNRGIIHKLKGDIKKAIKDFDKAIELKDMYWEAFYNRGNTYEDSGSYKKALEDYYRAAKINPRFDMAHYSIGAILESRFNNYGEALRQYSMAININPEHFKAYNNRGAIYANQGDYQKAIQDFDAVIRLNKKESTAYYNRGMLYKILNRPDLAARDIQTAVSLGDKRALEYIRSNR